MSTDEPGEAPVWQRAAQLLVVALREVGREALASPTVVRNLCADLLPDDPLVSQLLIGAAEFDVAGRLRRQLDLGLDTTGAVVSVTTAFGASSFAPYEYRRWVVENTALALGYGPGAGGSTIAGYEWGKLGDPPGDPTKVRELPQVPPAAPGGVPHPGARVVPYPLAEAPTWGVAHPPFAEAPPDGALGSPSRRRLFIGGTAIGIVAIGAVIAATVLSSGGGGTAPTHKLRATSTPTTTVPATTLPTTPVATTTVPTTTVATTTVPTTTIPVTTVPLTRAPASKPPATSNSTLAASYEGTATNTTAGVNATLSFADVLENHDGGISGQVLLGPPLVPSLAPFTGTVSGSVVTASVTYTASICFRSGCRAVFVGRVSSSGTISGTYVNTNGGGGTEYGTWEVHPD